jgi:hypothetical protein
MTRSGSTVLASMFFALSALLIAQATDPECVRPPDSHKVAKEATFFDDAVKTDAAELGAVEAFSSQKVSADIAKSFEWNLSAREPDPIRKKR